MFVCVWCVCVCGVCGVCVCVCGVCVCVVCVCGVCGVCVWCVCVVFVVYVCMCVVCVCGVWCVCVVCVCGVCACAQSCLTLCNPMDYTHQPLLSMGFSRQEYWSWLYFLLQEIFLTQESNSSLLHCRQILCCLSHSYSLIIISTL